MVITIGNNFLYNMNILVYVHTCITYILHLLDLNDGNFLILFILSFDARTKQETTNVMRTNSKQDKALLIEGKEAEGVNQFNYNVPRQCC